MDFRLLSGITALIAALLSVALMGIPELLFYLFNIEASDATYFMGRRASILFLGLALVSWQIRNISDNTAQLGVSLSFMVIMFGLAILGSIEFTLGNAGVGIFLAIITELTLGLFYLKIWREKRLRSNPV
ncbi:MULTISPECIES: hypothetical protein [Pseudoalteromonas]|uniref:hypothetical protein n=1 Tax=Pseudoalteromonas TaxID=53246 RepID=UPI00026CA9C8|nr:hypothetical protein [Pseudoalteromonas spongiae]ATC99665.1 hypothetical protein PSPO_a2763 [Pseudoalteromonas spongiae UST010723-006]